MIRIGFIVLAVALVGACQSDEEMRGSYGEACSTVAADDCIEGLMCVRPQGANDGVCTRSCTLGSDCSDLHPEATCMLGRCYQACATAVECSSSGFGALRCVATATASICVP